MLFSVKSDQVSHTLIEASENIETKIQYGKIRILTKCSLLKTILHTTFYALYLKITDTVLFVHAPNKII